MWVNPGEVLQTSLAPRYLDDSEAVHESIRTYSRVINYDLDLPTTSSSTVTLHHTSQTPQAVTPTCSTRQQSVAAVSAVPNISLQTSLPGRPDFRLIHLPTTSSSTSTPHRASQTPSQAVMSTSSTSAASKVPTVSLQTSPQGKPDFRFVHLPTTSSSVRASLSTPTANVHTSRRGGQNFRFVRLPGITSAAVTPHRSQPNRCVRPPSQNQFQA